jgi:6-phosphogluconolactonase
VSTSAVIVLPGDGFASQAAAHLAQLLVGLPPPGRRASLALAGGATPLPVYRELAGPTGDVVPWSRLELFFGDERAVPPTDEESNYGQIERALGARLRQVVRVERMEGERADLEAAALAYERALPVALDLVLLGMGEDGHVASLFPESPALDERARRVVPVLGPAPRRARLTITPPVLAAARRVVILVRGRAKAERVARVVAGDDGGPRLPAMLVRQGTWILDEDAASALPRRR